MPKEAISVKNLVKQYGDFTAVGDISFSVKEGDFFGFLGPNGAGKTTTMRILATLLKKTSGEVQVAGFEVDENPNGVRHSIGFAMQNISLDNLASGYENLQLLGVLYGLSPVEARKRADELLELVGLTKVASRWVNTYSGGMRRRLDLAGVLMHRPPIIFLDEPTEGLDPQARRTIWDYLRTLNDQGSTIFLTTHYMDEADALCRQIAFIDKGMIIKNDTPAKLKGGMGGDIIDLRFGTKEDALSAEKVVTKTTSKQAQVVEATNQVKVAVEHADQLVPKLVSDLDKAKLPPASLSVAQPSLEDVFISLVGRSLEEDTSGLVHGIDPFVQGRR